MSPQRSRLPGNRLYCLLASDERGAFSFVPVDTELFMDGHTYLFRALGPSRAFAGAPLELLFTLRPVCW